MKRDLGELVASGRESWRTRTKKPAWYELKKEYETVTGDLYKRMKEMKQSGLDVVLVFDQTGSMTVVIDSVKDRLDGMLWTLELLVDKLRVGVVTYTDRVAKTQPLTTNFGKVKSLIDGVNAAGGADYPEGVDKGLKQAVDGNKWRPNPTAKAIVIIGDAPPHPLDVDDAIATAKRAGDRKYLGISVHTVSTTPRPVANFPKIAKAGGGKHTTLSDPRGIERTLLTLSFGPEWEEAITPFLDVIAKVRDGLGK